MSQSIPSLLQVASPTIEPVSLDEAKLYLRIDSADEDTVLNDLIATARMSAEHYLRRSLITQTWKIVYDVYAPARIELMRGPVQSINSVRIIARDGGETLVDPINYYLSADKSILCINTSVLGHTVEVQYITGFGDAVAVPAPIKQGMLMHISQMFDNRAAQVIGSSTRFLYDDYRLLVL